MSVQTNGVYLGRHRGIPGLTWISSGKVRDIYALDERRLLFVASDRISAFDVVMAEGIPFKGLVLTAISAWWFQRTRDLVANHFISDSVDDVRGIDGLWRERLRGRVMIVERAAPTPVEWVVRGYLAGSGWKDYQKRGSVCGVELPRGLSLASRLPRPILTPTTKEAEHDRPLTPAQAQETVGPDLYGRAERAALALFDRGSSELAPRGILLADTKFEFGLRSQELLLIDELLTPDSSRFWPASQWHPGEQPPSFDKQILRDHLETLDWNKSYPPPAIDPAVLERLGERYLEICRRITGSAPERVAS